MSTADSQLDEMLQQHLLFQLLQTLDNGLVMLDRNYTITLWNGFMENHSGIHVSHARGKNLFDLFPDLPETWLKRKIDSVIKLQTRAFCTWEEHPRVFNFKSTRPLTGHSALMFQNITLIPLLGLDSQVNQVCMQVFDVTEIATKKIALQAANRSLEKLSRIDRLTGISNRGYWEDNLEQEFQRCKRSSTPSSLLMIDIDHFKQFNDRYGHVAGDEVLRTVARQIKRSQRATDQAGRYGGEEFAIILPETDIKKAMFVAERLRKQIYDLPIEWEKQPLHVTVSMGVSQFDKNMSTHKNWIDHTDAALYEAKDRGRNCCVAAGDYCKLNGA
ncbi:MAG: GGDEF domain-containing protein [Gammaproteobacteria bacterium]|nr:GGDEF domain-containing protein [Gammaproteobacteria bacterium]